ncbi:MAG TPA: alpha-amylase/4-alpha-glucanotransferase domain-containing protein, partial [Methylophilaceae bacterium]|nr:alpha-amylase/4-alpha-glucanotransferase domain-containing protein [Methylophilaceae bacterium]
EPRSAIEQADLDMDGHDEVFLQNGRLQAVIRLDGSASVCELDSYRLQHNFGDTLTRQAEHYHRKINLGAGHEPSGEGISNPHERVSFRHEILPADLAMDDYSKTLFRDFWLVDDVAQPILYAQIDAKTPNLQFESLDPGVQKLIQVENDSLVVAYSFAQPLGQAFQIEINLAMPSCDGPAGRLRVGEEILGGFGQAHVKHALTELWLEDEVLGGALRIGTSLPCRLTSAPHFSVSQSEAGFEKIMQAVTLQLSWTAQTPQEKLTVVIEVI